MFSVNGQADAALYHSVCALLSIPWVNTHSSVSANQVASFPADLIGLSKKLAPLYCKRNIFTVHVKYLYIQIIK